MYLLFLLTYLLYEKVSAICKSVDDDVRHTALISPWKPDDRRTFSFQTVPQRCRAVGRCLPYTAAYCRRRFFSVYRRPVVAIDRAGSRVFGVHVQFVASDDFSRKQLSQLLPDRCMRRPSSVCVSGDKAHHACSVQFSDF